MQIKSFIFTSVTLATFLNATPHTSHHSQNTNCDFQAIQKQAKTPSEEVNSLMHAPMMCSPWIESKNIEVDFLSNMIPHHQGAILSSEAFLKYAKNPQLIKIANEIISSQKQEIEQFQELLKKIDRKESQNYQKFALQAKADMHKMMQAMHQAHPSENIEKDYMLAMIAHHQGAIDASKQVLEHTQNQEVIRFAKEIISAQEKEIQEFKTLLKQ